jgi:hypothetical protein
MAAVKPVFTEEIHPDPTPLSPQPDRVSEDEDQQDGVRVAEAVTKTWSKKYLICAYAR